MMFCRIQHSANLFGPIRWHSGKIYPLRYNIDSNSIEVYCPQKNEGPNWRDYNQTFGTDLEDVVISFLGTKIDKYSASGEKPEIRRLRQIVHEEIHDISTVMNSFNKYVESPDSSKRKK